MKACILNSQTKIVENVIELATLDPFLFVPYKDNIELSSRHDGEIGWVLLDDNTWDIGDVPLTEEQLSNRVRRKRKNLLKQSDVYVLPDFPITELKRQEWLTYRQLLRDITVGENFPNNITWPIKPSK
jgi:hypothetical protein